MTVPAFFRPEGTENLAAGAQAAPEVGHARAFRTNLGPVHHEAGARAWGATVTTRSLTWHINCVVSDQEAASGRQTDNGC
jgi:hypothetical protein